MKRFLFLALVFSCSFAWAGYGVERTEALGSGELEGKGQITNPRVSPDGKAIFFEFLAADGETAEVYVSTNEKPGSFPPKLGKPATVVPSKKKDVFSLGGPGDQSISEHPSWGPANKRGQSIAVAATRKEASRGGSQINFDIFFTAPGKRRFLTEHPENDSEPVFNKAGDYLVFSSGRTGEGDLYAYSFFAESDPIRRLTFEEAGSELYSAWSPNDKSLAYIGHLGGADHLFLIDDVPKLAGEKSESARRAMARSVTKDLTPGWQHSCLAPAFSPDGKYIAFFMHPKNHQTRTDLYVVKVSGGDPVLLMENVLAPTRGGPCWAPDSNGVFVVEESATNMNPIHYVSLDPKNPSIQLDTGTQLNTDLSMWVIDGAPHLLFAAQGGGEGDAEKRWRKIYISRLLK